jgi:hypothetical protein
MYERKNLTIKRTRYKPIEYIPLPVKWQDIFDPRIPAQTFNGRCFSSVVMFARNNKFFSKPAASPSVVSAGHSIPHWLGRNEGGPLTFWVFSNLLLTWVIIPNADTYSKREKTCNTHQVIMPQSQMLFFGNKRFPRWSSWMRIFHKCQSFSTQSVIAILWRNQDTGLALLLEEKYFAIQTCRETDMIQLTKTRERNCV